MAQHPASIWIDEHWMELLSEFNNLWIGASGERVVAKGETFDMVLEEAIRSEINLAEIVFVFLTTDAVQ